MLDIQETYPGFRLDPALRYKSQCSYYKQDPLCSPHWGLEGHDSRLNSISDPLLSPAALMQLRGCTFYVT